MDQIERQGLVQQLKVEPVVHFLLIALVLYVAYGVLAAPEENERAIFVDSGLLANFVSQRNPELSPADAKNIVANMDKEARSALIADYVRDEVLFREARALGLDRDDYARKRQLINRWEYVNDTLLRDAVEVTDEDVVQWFAEHQTDYRVPARLSFTHVFLSDSGQSSRERAMTLLAKLNEDKVDFNNHGPLGDRFLYHRNYVTRDSDEIAAHFGDAFASEVFQLEVSNSWQGPIASSYGLHLVYVRDHTSAYLPQLREVKKSVKADLIQAKLQMLRQQEYERALGQYKVELDSELGEFKAGT